MIWQVGLVFAGEGMQQGGDGANDGNVSAKILAVIWLALCSSEFKTPSLVEGCRRAANRPQP